jgi:integrase
MAVDKASLVQVQTWMGHAHIQTTARYLPHRVQHSDAALPADAFRATSPMPAQPAQALRRSGVSD